MLALKLHPAQRQILRTLRYSPSCRYTDLRKPTGLDSDVFKFHLRKLVDHGYIIKTSSGLYELSSNGKEFANNLSKLGLGIQKQPKLSVMLIIKNQNTGEYLFQKRKRSPHFGYWGLMSGPVQWGESFEDAAVREAAKQTGFKISAHVSGFLRLQDINERNDLLEDKLFVIIDCKVVNDSIISQWRGGECVWMSIQDLESKKQFFADTRDYIELSQSDTKYMSRTASYNSQLY